MSNLAMGIDLVVMLLTITGLALSPSRSSLWQLLFRQGVIYFVVAFVANSLPAIFLMLNLNGTYFQPGFTMIVGLSTSTSVFNLTFSINEHHVHYPRNDHHSHRVLSLVRQPHQLPITRRLRPLYFAPSPITLPHRRWYWLWQHPRPYRWWRCHARFKEIEKCR